MYHTCKLAVIINQMCHLIQHDLLFLCISIIIYMLISFYMSGNMSFELCVMTRTRKSCSETNTKAALLSLDHYFKIVCSQRLIRSLADIAVYICQIIRRSAGNFFLKRANKYFFVSGPSN